MRQVYVTLKNLDGREWEASKCHKFVDGFELDLSVSFRSGDHA